MKKPIPALLIVLGLAMAGCLEREKRKPSKIVLIHEGLYNRLDSGVAYFPGTDILARCDGRTAVIDSIPSGLMRLVVESRSGWAHDTAIVSARDTVHVTADRSKMTWR